ncbi:hypothetical protein BV20DRAFT_984133 [Pilatotrama ljubarskyi]|nr:hypothetical protein BV20DRAFT_984133 [Pilatotrama ljubarskyi]
MPARSSSAHRPHQQNGRSSGTSGGASADDLEALEAAEVYADLDTDFDGKFNLPIKASVRKQYNALIEDLKISKKSGRWRVESQTSPLDLLHKVARMVMRMHGPYLAIGQAVGMGLTICAASSVEDACKRSAALRECTPELRKRFVHVGEWLIETVPFLRPMLPLFEEHPLDLILFSNFVDIKADDSGDPDRPSFTISPLVRGIFDHKRANWGWNSLWSARLLVWRSAREKFDEDPEEYTERLQHGNLTNNANGFPSFLYKEFEGAWDPEGYRGIWTSPNLASREPGMRGTAWASISRAHCIEVVCPENIAYITCLNAQDPKVFDGAAFFTKIVDLLEIDDIAEPVISHFQHYVYGAPAGTGTSTNAGSDCVDEFEALKLKLAQCATSAASAASGVLR